MYRTLALIGALLFGIVGCGTGNGPTPTSSPSDSGFWTTPHPAADSVQIENRIRQIDVCALIPRETLNSLGSVRTVGDTNLSTCDAQLGSAEDYKGTDVQWSDVFSTRPIAVPKGTQQTVGAVTYTYQADRDGLPAAQFAQLVQRTCTATARFVSGAALMMFVDTPLGTEPCPVAQRLLPDAMRAWTAEPKQGASPATAHSVLLGADPCAIQTRLGVPATQSVHNPWECDFRYHNQDVILRYEYRQQNSLTSDATAIPDGPHTIYRATPAPDQDGYWGYNSPVGPAIEPQAPSDFTGPYLPNVYVSSKSDTVSQDVIRQAISQFH
ncbi:hypothetical protein [Nocardia alni]|uniref:hypothetical protein n=1 Tax=Nocardia alni TaxID=2815723 RepID=UPI001C2497FE|nr:hypothetical protein [Nocardia alni]